MPETIAPTDTPTFEVDIFAADGITPVTPNSAVVTVYNVGTRATVSGSPIVTIGVGKVTVTIPGTMTGSAGQFQADCAIQVDAITQKTVSYQWTVRRTVI